MRCAPPPNDKRRQNDLGSPRDSIGSLVMCDRLSLISSMTPQDVSRTFTTHPLFRPSRGATGGTPHQEMLRNILRGVSVLRPDISYCQGLNFIAAMLLLVLHDEERSFWTLGAILKHLFPTDYFNGMLSGARVDQVRVAGGGVR